MKSIIQNEWDECFICHKKATEEHHCIGGINRKHADKLGLTVHLCHECHEKVHNEKPEWKKDLIEIAQTKYEETHTREEFMKIFGRNFL